MHEIKCPHCHTAFTVNEASYADILNQVRTQEFQTEIHERLQQAQMQFQSDMQLAQAQAQNQFDKILADKNHEIAALSNQINAYEKDRKLAAAEIEGRLKAQPVLRVIKFQTTRNLQQQGKTMLSTQAKQLMQQYKTQFM